MSMRDLRNGTEGSDNFDRDKRKDEDTVKWWGTTPKKHQCDGNDETCVWGVVGTFRRPQPELEGPRRTRFATNTAGRPCPVLKKAEIRGILITYGDRVLSQWCGHKTGVREKNDNVHGTTPDAPIAVSVVLQKAGDRARVVLPTGQGSETTVLRPCASALNNLYFGSECSQKSFASPQLSGQWNAWNAQEMMTSNSSASSSGRGNDRLIVTCLPSTSLSVRDKFGSVQ
ncbi:hypothetical protein MTO96_004796 [Rhipicephalus appendiculatus]